MSNETSSSDYGAAYTSFSGAEVNLYVDDELSQTTQHISVTPRPKILPWSKYKFDIDIVSVLFDFEDVFDKMDDKEHTFTVEFGNGYGRRLLAKISGVKLISKEFDIDISDITTEISYKFEAKKVEYFYNEKSHQSN